MGALTARVRGVQRAAARLLDRVSEHGIPQLSATSLALFGLYNAASFGFFADRYTGLASFSTVFAVAHPAVWAGLYALTSLILLYGSVRDRDFVKGATLGLCAVHALIGVMTIYPIVGPLEAPPTAFSAYATPAVWCYLTFLLWRIRVAKR
jgi:hypothetical protein